MDGISDELLARIWSSELSGGEQADQGPWTQKVETNFSIQKVTSIAVIEGNFVTCVATVDWSPGSPVITSEFARIDMGAVAAAADTWREDM